MIEPKGFIWNTKVSLADADWLKKHNNGIAAKERVKKPRKPKPKEDKMLLPDPKPLMAKYGTNERELKSPARSNNIAACRREIARLMRRHGFNSFDVGALLNREASTIRKLWRTA